MICNQIVLSLHAAVVSHFPRNKISLWHINATFQNVLQK